MKLIELSSFRWYLLAKIVLCSIMVLVAPPWDGDLDPKADVPFLIEGEMPWFPLSNTIPCRLTNEEEYQGRALIILR